MSTTRVSEKLARPARTTGQFGLGFAIVALIHSFHHFTPEQYTALTGFATIVFGYIQVAVENRAGWAFMRTVTAKSAPVIGEETEPVKKTTSKRKSSAGYGLVGLLILLVAVALILGGLVTLLFALFDAGPHGVDTHGVIWGIVLVILGIVVAYVGRAVDGAPGSTRL